MTYWLNSENFSIERPLVPRINQYRVDRDEFIILKYLVESNVDVDVLKIQAEISIEQKSTWIKKFKNKFKKFNN